MKKRPFRNFLGGVVRVSRKIPAESPPATAYHEMLRRRRKRLLSTSASILGLFVVVILLLLPTRAAALSRKQRILNWFAEASQGGGDQKANKAVEDEALAVNSLTSVMKSSGESLPGTIAPPPLLDQMLTLFASLGLPPDTLSHMSELTPEEIVHVSFETL